MNKFTSIGLMVALSGTGMAALAQQPTPTPTPTPAPAPTQQTLPRLDTKVQPTPSVAAKEATSATASSKDAASQQIELQAMDANHDGLVSRQEYMAHYEGLYGKIKKDSAGMINLKDLASATPVATAR